MNREIKFRVWDKVDKKFLSLKDYQDLGAIEVENDGTLTLSPRFRFLTSMMIMPERFIPLQYTGLKDKNGKEIYEGDLIRYKNGGIEEIDEVFFDKEYGTFEIAFNRNKSNSATLGFWIADLDEESSYEIIGNIYEREENNENI